MENYERNPETYVSRKILKKSKKLSRMALKTPKTYMKMLEITFAFFGAVILLLCKKPALIFVFSYAGRCPKLKLNVLNIVDELKDLKVVERTNRNSFRGVEDPEAAVSRIL